MALKCLVFDCDGVILDSMPVKSRAFARLAEPYGAEARDRLVMYHNIHGGVSRYLKFAWFFREFIGREITPEESEEWGRKFREYSLEEVRRCDLIPGVLETLKKWRGILSIYVCTGAPQEEARFILNERGLSGYFKAICGYPPTKAETLAKIVNKQECIMPEEALMIGDSITDRDAAEKAETLFYGVGAELKGNDIPWSMDLRPLNDWIASRL